MSVEKNSGDTSETIDIRDLTNSEHQAIAGRLRISAQIWYEIEAVTSLPVGAPIEIETQLNFFLGEVIYRSYNLHAWVMYVKVKHRIPKTKCSPSGH